MKRTAERAAGAGYRRDWRGIAAYLFTPEAWTATAYTAFAVAVGGFTTAAILNAATETNPFFTVPIMVLMGYGFIVGPMLRVAERRASHRSPSDSR